MTLSQRIALKERLRVIRNNQPSQTSEEAYAQMQRNSLISACCHEPMRADKSMLSLVCRGCNRPSEHTLAAVSRAMRLNQPHSTNQEAYGQCRRVEKMAQL